MLAPSADSLKRLRLRRTQMKGLTLEPYRNLESLDLIFSIGEKCNYVVGENKTLIFSLGDQARNHLSTTRLPDRIQRSDLGASAPWMTHADQALSAFQQRPQRSRVRSFPASMQENYADDVKKS